MSTISPNMNLIIPGVGATLGPEWADNLNSDLSLLDQHNHSPGSGTPINPSGLDINSDLSLKQNNATEIRSLRFSSQAAPLAVLTDVGCLYESGVDLYFNDGNGNHVRITQSGGVAGSPGSISNLTSPASATYVAGTQTFVWQSNVNTAANLDAANVILRNNTASSFGITLSPPTLSSNYSIVLPALPASTKFMRIDNSGNIGASVEVDNSSLEINTNVLQIKTVDTAKITDAAVTTIKIADLNVTRPKLVAVGQQVSASCGNYSSNSTSLTNVTNLNVTITTTGRPVMVRVQSEDTGLGSGFSLSKLSTAATRANLYLVRDGVSVISNARLGFNTLDSLETPAELSCLDVVAAGTYTYKMQTQITSADGIIAVNNCVLIAYEL